MPHYAPQKATTIHWDVYTQLNFVRDVIGQRQKKKKEVFRDPRKTKTIILEFTLYKA